MLLLRNLRERNTALLYAIRQIYDQKNQNNQN